MPFRSTHRRCQMVTLTVVLTAVPIPGIAQCEDVLREADGLIAAVEHGRLSVGDEVVTREVLHRAKDLQEEARELEAEDQHQAAAALVQAAMDLVEE